MIGKKDLVRRLAERKYGTGNLDARKLGECEQMYDYLEEVITDALTHGEKIVLKGFLTICVRNRKARKARNPKTNEIVTFPPVRVINCKPAQALRDAINRKGDDG